MMEISKLYENAAEKLEKAIEVCGKSKINLSSLTVISTPSGQLYSGINWKTLNDSFEEELTCSEDEAISKMLLSGETQIEHIVTLDPETKLPVNPCQKCLELILTINPANVNSNVITGKNSKVILTSVNSDIAKFAEKIVPAPAEEQPANAADVQQPETSPTVPEGEPEGTAAQTGIDASGLKMIFDDWESAGEAADNITSKPFNANSLTAAQADQAEVISQVQNMSNNGYQQMNGMYAQPMNGMYGQQMNGMYAQPMNGMYQQQMNGMYGQQNGGMYQQQMNGMYGAGQQSVMYGQQPANNGMYQQQNGGMYQQQMNGMYGQQQNNGARTSLYLNNQPAGGNGTSPQQNNMYNMPGTSNAAYQSKLQTPVSHSSANTQSVSVYGTNMNDSDNNALFKDRLNNILNSGPSGSKNENGDKMDVMMSAKEKKIAAKKDAKKK